MWPCIEALATNVRPELGGGGNGKTCGYFAAIGVSSGWTGRSKTDDPGLFSTEFACVSCPCAAVTERDGALRDEDMLLIVALDDVLMSYSTFAVGDVVKRGGGDERLPSVSVKVLTSQQLQTPFDFLINHGHIKCFNGPRGHPTHSSIHNPIFVLWLKIPIREIKKVKDGLRR